jgi:hypothetical protein
MPNEMQNPRLLAVAMFTLNAALLLLSMLAS